MEKLEKRLAGWKRLYLFKGGRLTLIKSTLSRLPTYYLLLFPLLVSIACCIEKLQRDFLWGGVGDEHRFHLVNWKQVCTPMPHGGLGFWNMTLFNKALLGQWLWRCASKTESLWRRVVDCKYGSQRRGWCSNEGREPYGVSLWKYIRSGLDYFSQYLTYKVGDGTWTQFWQDSWCGDQPLRDRFPELYRFARALEAMVASHLRVHGSTHLWDIEFSRPF